MNKKISLAMKSLCIVVMYLITYAIVIRQMGYGNSDFNAHSGFARLLNEGRFAELIKKCPYPLWHILVAIADGILKIPANHAAAFITALFNVFLYCVVFEAFREETETRAEIFIPLGALVLCLLESFYIPWYSKGIYTGQIVANIWHNPTNMCVKPFMLLTFLQIQSAFSDCSKDQTMRKKRWIIIAVLMCICNLAKPSCAQIFIPGVGIVGIGMLLKDFKKYLTFVLKMAAAILPCAVLAVIQYGISFYLSPVSDGGVEIAWLAVWKAWSPNILLSLLLSLAFPLYYYIAFANQTERYGMDERLAVSIFSCGLLEYAMLAETGERRYHGNFVWGLQLAVFLVYFVSVKRFYTLNMIYEYDNQWERRKILAGWIILFLQFFFGMYYIMQLLSIEGKWF